MTAIPTVLVRATPEATARVAELGLQAELEQMLEQIRQVVPELRHIDVEFVERYDMGGEPGVSINAWSGLPWQQTNDVWWSLAEWEGATFPPQVLQHLSIDVLPGGNHAGQSVSGSGPGSGQGQR